jgi:hypothetical protein
MPDRPKIAIIGGGIFGVSIARELAQFVEVTLFERDKDIFGGATWGNQQRHHYGYHYHQSDETAEQCKMAKKDFESVWGEGILDGFPNYYGISKKGSKLTPEAFKDFCDKHSLPYKEEWPSEDLANRDEIAACFRTSEPVYDYERLKSMAKRELLACGVDLRVGQEVINGDISGGQKEFTIRNAGEIYTEAFDYAVNATYADFNNFCNWFKFSHQEIDFRLKELLLIRIPGLSPVGVTIMDNFISLLPTGHPGVFTFGDVVNSRHAQKSSSGAMPWNKQELAQFSSNKQILIDEGRRFSPVLGRAEFVESLWTVLPLKARSSNAHDRLTEVVNHGQRCWSVFGGKIITCVTVARQVAKEVRSNID